MLLACSGREDSALSPEPALFINIWSTSSRSSPGLVTVKFLLSRESPFCALASSKAVALSSLETTCATFLRLPEYADQWEWTWFPCTKLCKETLWIRTGGVWRQPGHIHWLLVQRHCKHANTNGIKENQIGDMQNHKSKIQGISNVDICKSDKINHATSRHTSADARKKAKPHQYTIDTGKNILYPQCLRCTIWCEVY